MAAAYKDRGKEVEALGKGGMGEGTEGPVDKKKQNSNMKEHEASKSMEGPWQVVQKSWHGKKLSEGKMRKTMTNNWGGKLGSRFASLMGDVAETNGK